MDMGVCVCGGGRVVRGERAEEADGIYWQMPVVCWVEHSLWSSKLINLC